MKLHEDGVTIKEQVESFTLSEYFFSLRKIDSYIV
jgi:hypothetical protein